MSSPAHATPDGHGHAHGGKDHVPHVLPLKVYLGAWGALLVLTVVTVLASYFNFGTWNLVIALVIATMKAATVALLFMHLYFDNKFHAIILSSSLIFLAVFIGFTMFDTQTRGRADSKEHERTYDSRDPFPKAAVTAAPAAIEVPYYGAGAPAGAGQSAAVVAPAASASAAAGPVASGAPGAAPAPASSAAPATSGSAVGSSAAPATSGSAVPTLSSAAPAASAAPGATSSASATPQRFVPGGVASFTTRPAMRGDEPRGPAAALMSSATGAARPAPSASAAQPPKTVPAH